MKDANTMVRDSIKIGMHVKISLHPNQKEDDFEEGIVEEILSDEKFDEKGIEVKIDNGYIGHIEKIIKKDSTLEEIQIRITQRENTELEKKETFAFDTTTNAKNDELKKVVCIAVASLMNTKGGYVYIGVDDDGNVKGLERDYSLMQNGGNNDKLELQIRDAIRKYLADQVPISNFIDISFHVIDGKEICEIRVSPASEPVFSKEKIYNVSINNVNQQRKFDDFYIREGNGKKLLEKHSDFLSYWKVRFNESE
ncbi:hypothetical protein C6988_02485 [Nitrosopumilus sp. b1]|uniref:RNA-binding domain-containing protein n=1 Tax=Nitrosopumilus sp. b1 TaxID=2109907 RepID=UPI0015F5E768|nr:RNA-binding domain-containing protein [Nitrosopumilus sp. b1]KAF6243629.1 hypothetical protein C6988_02485 [Nitrosopumilus sp. b1]